MPASRPPDVKNYETRTMRRAFLTAAVAACAALAAGTARAAEPGKVDYGRDIRPILAQSCYACHGPDDKARKAKLRLDLRAEAIKEAIVPGKAADSPLFQRVHSTDPDEVMPPPKSKKPALTKDQIELIRRWIDQGAKFDQHWAYVKPTRPAVPTVANPKFPIRNPIDAFIAAGHAKHNLTPAPEADKATLVRRLYLDLTGLPPTPEEVDAFLKDAAPDAYDKLVERLLASKHYGERMAVYWLDLVRYADTGGYHSDNHRDVALYRDYAIQSFNENKPFDKFTVEQLARDLLPNAGDEQRIASGYNRMLQTTEEGGAQAKEYAAKYAADRVRNAGAVWLGSTFGCAECHDHKYDPFKTRDFYRFQAFFADVQERAVGRQEQTPFPGPEQAARLKQLDAEIAKFQAELAKSSPELEAAQAEWEKKVHKDKPKGLPKPVADALAVEPAKRSAAQKKAVADHFRTVSPQLESARTGLAQAKAERDRVAKEIPTTLVSKAGPPRTVRILPRGNWLDDSGEVVTPDVPAFLGSVEHGGKRASRLDLANWFVSRDNPLVARVAVNRLWKIGFGQGIVRTMEDFGTQGAPPSHPELLDWLAVEFVESGWDVKHVLRLMVKSSAYRQSSVGTKEQHDRDPTNLWLARQNRFRLDAEFVRDNALAVSGLLVRKVGGPSVKPYQPAGYWAYLNFPRRTWVADKGENQYRRGLYTYRCRSFLHPSLLAFDAPTREECTAERPRSSTPLQALVLLNDPTYVEAARVLAARMVKEGGPNPAARLDWAYRHAVSRAIKPEEAQVLEALYRKHLAEYRNDRPAAERLIGTGDAPVPKDIDAAELAAWTSVARVILNLHETITRN